LAPPKAFGVFDVPKPPRLEPPKRDVPVFVPPNVDVLLAKRLPLLLPPKPVAAGVVAFALPNPPKPVDEVRAVAVLLPKRLPPLEVLPPPKVGFEPNVDPVFPVEPNPPRF
jgi:hypothetical protein